MSDLNDCPVALRALTTTQTRALHRACELAGGVEQLAARRKRRSVYFCPPST
jgi:hypothetical protein